MPNEATTQDSFSDANIVPSRITINFDPKFPSSNLADQAFELIVTDDEPTNSASQFGPERRKGGGFPAWLIGRHPVWCDLVVEPQCRALSVIHATIAYNRALDSWMILDGGVYLEGIKYSRHSADVGELIESQQRQGRRRHYNLDKPPGYGASSYGVWVNNYRLPPKNFEPIEPGDRILLDDSYKLIVSENPYVTIGPQTWLGYWKDEREQKPGQVSVSHVETDLKKQVEDRAAQIREITWPYLLDKVLNGPDDLDSKYWWIFLVCVCLFGFYVWAKYVVN